MQPFGAFDIMRYRARTWGDIMQAIVLHQRGGWKQATGAAGCGIAKNSGLLGVCALSTMIIAAAVQPGDDGDETLRHAAASIAGGGSASLSQPVWAIGGYGGVSHTYPDTVRIKKGDSEVTARGFDWLGQPFKAPVYYGARVQRWNTLGRTGAMIDFIHAKAIANPDSEARFTGSHNGQALPQSAKIRDVFSKLEFSHGHNILTLNGLARLGHFFGRLRPYIGPGAGVSLPHTEFGYAKENIRTYEYQFAGFAGQALAGIEIDLGRSSLFLEYKFTYAPHDVPLSHEPTGWLLVTDVWKQLTAWWRGEEPPGGRLTVNLVSHHAVAGVMVKATRPGAAVTP